MKVLLFIALLGITTADQRPPSSYGAPNGGFGNGSGASNGAPSNGYTAPGNNGFGAFASNGNGAPFGNGFAGAPSNGYGAPPSNGYGAPPSNGYGAPPSNGYGAPPSNRYGPPTGSYGLDPELLALQENIPGGGVPGEDYPVLSSPPDTGFSCDDQAVAGYYADTAPDASCQVFHICQDRAVRRQKDSFLCPNGTIFNQQYLVCDWWFNVDCSQAENFYSVNEQIGVVPSAGYGYGPIANSIFNGNGNGNGNRYNNGNRPNGNGNRYNNGNRSNGNGKRRNGNGASRYGSSGNGRNGNGANGYRRNGNGVSNGYSAPAAPSTAYGTQF
ncbi:pro-resilin-like [Cherax quadricarinatus]|uniref:pro-resilin-like n=1 Tax=Cherax quadricarinatus TaxID=27406 RepID=UPI00387ED3F0